MKTLHLGPEELLVAAKIGVDRGATAAGRRHDRRGRGGHPGRGAHRHVIYLEPDIYRADYVPGAPGRPAPAAH